MKKLLRKICLQKKTKIVVLTALFIFIHAVKNSYISTAITCRKHIISDFGLKDKQVQAKQLFKESEIFCSGSDGSAM